MRVIDIYFSEILLDEKSNENLLLEKKSYAKILIYNVSYKTFMDAEPLRIWLDKMDLLKFICF